MLKRKLGTMFLIALAAGSVGSTQTRSVAPAAAGTGSAGRAGQDAAPDTRTEKQKALAAQADRLYTMATELKAQVDLTNKNILSLKVVQKAEEIEALAKGMRGQVKK